MHFDDDFWISFPQLSLYNLLAWMNVDLYLQSSGYLLEIWLIIRKKSAITVVIVDIKMA